MRRGVFLGAVTTLCMAAALPASAQDRVRVAIMPTQYFSANAESAERFTEALHAQFGDRDVELISEEQAMEKFRGMGLNSSRHYPDRVATKFGRQLGADVVVYPRLLAMGMPVNDVTPISTPAGAVVHVRVINTQNNKLLYFRQVEEPITSERATSAAFVLPRREADQAVAKALSPMWERVAGFREVLRNR